MINYLDITNEVAQFAGALVVGDIHGNWPEFEIVLHQAREENLFLISLGDVMDYGLDNVKCFRELNALILNGQARMLIGNHEFKLFKYINQSREQNVRVRRQGGILTTIQDMEKLEPNDLVSFEDEFINTYDNSCFIMSCGNYFFAHGAIDPKFWDQYQFAKATRSMSMFGQVDMKATPREDGYPTRRYDWVDYIPVEKTVIVGHDIRNKAYPHYQNGRKGGKAIFLDTGSSKGGQLSAMKLTF
ncbi:MAG: metallophosphoesterase [Gammaproteobacteria bacterium]|nr:metallophosphoesterase [Gammaproteobacteria bacterium]